MVFEPLKYGEYFELLLFLSFRKSSCIYSEYFLYNFPVLHINFQTHQLCPFCSCSACIQKNNLELNSHCSGIFSPLPSLFLLVATLSEESILQDLIFFSVNISNIKSLQFIVVSLLFFLLYQCTFNLF